MCLKFENTNGARPDNWELLWILWQIRDPLTVRQLKTFFPLVFSSDMENMMPFIDSGEAQDKSCLCFTSMTPTWHHLSPGQNSWQLKALIASEVPLTMGFLLPLLWRSATNMTSWKVDLMGYTPTLPPMVFPSVHRTRTGKPSRLSATQTICYLSPVSDRGMWTQQCARGTTTTPETESTGVTTRHPCRQLCLPDQRSSPLHPSTSGMKAPR